jgi:AmmeMemoRadiSam system protein A
VNKEIQNYLLKVARKAISDELEIEAAELKRPQVEGVDVLDEKRGVFVTLESGGQLRGCIGNIMPIYPLEEAVRRNAVNAAFDDPRFEPLDKEEFENMELEVSVLSVPEKLGYSSSDDLLDKLEPLKDGVIVRNGHYEATYLPQVWEKVQDKEMFLGSLCMKAGMSADEWKSGELEVLTYQAEVFKEE